MGEGEEWHWPCAVNSSWFKNCWLCKQNVSASSPIYKRTATSCRDTPKLSKGLLTFLAGLEKVGLLLPLLFTSLFNEDGETLGLLKSFRLASAVCNYCGRKSLNAWHTFLISGDLRSYFYLMWAWHYSLFRNSFGNTEVFHSHITFPVHRGTWETLCNYLSGEWQVKGIFKIIAIIISLTPS